MLQLPAGTLFGGRYEVIDCLGAGGMGAVYLASDPRYRDFKVALKVLYPGIIKTPEARERFRTEIVASYKIPHRNVVRAYEYFDEESVQAYTMEYVSGGDLQHRMRAAGIALEDTISILRQVAAGLIAIHEAGIVHRDLKPENILLTHHNQVKIGDFGVARLRESDSSVTQIGAMVGTPKYFAPEYIETGECDHRGDLYALGVIAYELIAGVSPFRSDSSIGMMIERIKRPQDPLVVIAPHCPLALARIIEKAMAISVLQRYQTANEMLEDLILVQEGKPLRYAKDFKEVPPSSEKEAEVHASISLQEVANSGPHVGFQPQALSRRSVWPKKQVMAAVMLGLCLVCGGFNYWRGTQSSFRALEPGGYKGVVTTDAASAVLEEIYIWKSEAGSISVVLVKDSCEPSVLSKGDVFQCAGKSYRLSVSASNAISAFGEIHADHWPKPRAWSVSRKVKAD